MMLSELFEQFRLQALMLLKDAEESGFLDDLTGCYNRKAYDIRKEQLPATDVGVIFVDVNGLKQVNDTQGHKAGDVLIRDLGKMLKANKHVKSIRKGEYKEGGDGVTVVSLKK